MGNNFKTKTEVVYERLRDDISTGKLKPGEKINISDLSKKMGFSGMPVREAMRKLESEGFVKVTPHVGMHVSIVDLNEILEIYLVRIELEALAAKLATPLLKGADLKHLEKIVHEMEEAVQNNHLKKYSALNKDFHFSIYRISPTPFLFNLIVELWEKVHRLENKLALLPERAPESLQEHKQMFQAASRGDGETMVNLIRLQKRNSMNAMVNFARKNGESVDDFFLHYL